MFALLWSMARDLSGSGPLAVLVVLQPLIAVLSLFLLPYAVRKRGRVLPWPLSAVLCELALGFVAGLVLVTWARTRFTQRCLGLAVDTGTGSSRDGILAIARAVAEDFDTRVLLSLAALIAVPVLGIVVGCRWARALRKDGRSTGLSLVVLVSVGALVWVTALGVFMQVMKTPRGFHWFSSPEDAYLKMLETYEVPRTFRRIVVGIGVVALAMVSVLGFRRKAGGGDARTWNRVGAGVFLLGAVAFGATRSMARDGENPLPFVDALLQTSALPPDMPPAGRCVPFPEDSPVLSADRGHFFLDGMPISEAEQMRRSLKDKREVWKQTHPNKPFQGDLVLALPANTLMSAVVPLLAASRADSVDRFHVAYALPIVRVETRTLGTVQRTPQTCSLQIPPGLAADEKQSWGQWAKQVEAQQP